MEVFKSRFIQLLSCSTKAVLEVLIASFNNEYETQGFDAVRLKHD